MTRRIVFLFTILDTAIIGECLIARGRRYIPDGVRPLLLGAEAAAAGIL